MKKLILLIVLLCSISLSFSQEKELSKEEKAKRERNIQAGNPFKEFGYKPKIATLSKGKYLEFHDLDSIVQIGSFTFHVKKKIINGYSQEETKYSEATLRPEIVSRWFNPDPLSDEFPSWSPYNFVMNNPIRFIDPDGRAPVDIILRGANNSSITIVTDLIDISVNAGSLVGDLGSNYSFSGDDILVAGLDIVGIFDPSPISDGLAATIEGRNGNYGSAILSGLGVIPYVGDIAKVGKIGKHIKTINNAIDGVKAVHGNSKLSKKVQHGYEIFNNKTKNILEYGISGQKRSAKQIDNLGSPRINQKLKTKYGNDPNVSGRVIQENIPNRKGALNWENNQVKQFKKSNNGQKPARQVRPDGN
jgi:hypothetical protein